MALERWFRRKKPNRKDDDKGPKGLWIKCESCGSQIYRKDIVASLYLCPDCGYHYRMPVDDRMEMLLDEDSFEQWSGTISSVDPLEFVDLKPYTERLKDAQDKHKYPDAILTGAGLLNGQRVAIAVMDFNFNGGSMGSVVGEEITRAAERAAQENRALITVTASGGARMQEGALSLMQMAKTTIALAGLAEKKLPFISILTDPTTGGTTASFATLGDIIIAEPKALIAFAGPRVIEQTVKQELPEGFQRSEFLLEKGMLDDVISRKDLKQKVSNYLGILMSNKDEDANAA